MPTAIMRKCGTCKEKKPANTENFSPRSATRYRYGLNSVCKPCVAKLAKKYKKNKKDERLEEFLADNKKWARNSHLRRNYGLDTESYEAEISKREGKCDLCHTIPNSKLVPDHDHNSGKLRGFLCQSCNNGLGRLGDDYASIYRAAVYLLKSEVE